MQTIIDCHCHVYPDKVAERAVEGIRSFYDMPLLFDGKISTMQQAERQAGVTHCLIFSVATRPDQAKSINEFIAGAVKKSEGTLTGLGTIHPDTEDPEGDLEYLVKLGLHGVKMHPDFQAFPIDDQRCNPIYRACAEKKLPILMHTGDSRFDYSNPRHMQAVLEAFPELKVVGAHLGGWSVWNEAVDTLSGYPNFFVDCSSSLYALPPEEAKSIIRRYGADHVLFGTDYPMWSPREELERLQKLGLTGEELELILHGSAEKVFSI